MRKKRYIEQGIAELVPGVLFIDEVHMLDIECFSFLNRALESTIAPIVVMATNRGVATVRGTKIAASHGIPVDLMDRLLVIRTTPYTIHELAEIVRTRANAESIQIDPDAIAALATIGQRSSLRFAIMLLTPTKIVAKTNGNETITRTDVDEADKLFIDAKRSGSLLTQQKEKFLL